MAEALHNSQQALREHQAVLEERIAQRTEDLRHLAHHDPLTELPNRRELATRLASHDRAARRRRRPRCALLYLDIDNFKTINDTLGHQFGDRVLRAIAARLLAIAGKVGFLARLGGDEFTLVVPTVKSAVAVERFMAHILREFATPLRVDDRELLVSLSAGIALYPQHGDSVESLLRAADSALHDAKDKGRNGFQVYRAELLAGASHRFHTEQALRHALGDRRLPAALPARSLAADETDDGRRGAAALATAGRAHRRRRASSSRSPNSPACCSNSATGCCAAR